MQQFCLYGSVRGVPGNQHPYRDKMGSDGRFRLVEIFSWS